MKKTIFAIICMIILGITTYSALAGVQNVEETIWYSSNPDGGSSAILVGMINGDFHVVGQSFNITNSSASTINITAIKYYITGNVHGANTVIDIMTLNGYTPDTLLYTETFTDPAFTDGWVNNTFSTKISVQRDVRYLIRMSRDNYNNNYIVINGDNNAYAKGYATDNYNSWNPYTFDLAMSVFFDDYVPPVLSTIEWENREEENGTIHNHPLNMEFNLTTEGIATCVMYYDGNVADTLANVPSGIYELNYSALGNETGYHEFYINCTNDAGTTQSSIKSIGFDFLLPIITLIYPTDGINIYRPNGLNYSVMFENVQLDSVNVTFIQNNIVVNETGNIYVNQPSYNLSDIVSSDDISLGEIEMIAWANHSSGGDYQEEYNFFLMDCPELVEDWTAQYTLCNYSNEQILTYEDANSCGTFDDLPVGNNTVSACNYCTLTYSTTVGDCIVTQGYGTGTRTTSYDYTNYGSCCGLTGLPEDCNLPANTTASCSTIGMHSSNEISGAVIDFGVEYGIFMVSMVGIIALVGLYIWGKKWLK